MQNPKTCPETCRTPLHHLRLVWPEADFRIEDIDESWIDGILLWSTTVNKIMIIAFQ